MCGGVESGVGSRESVSREDQAHARHVPWLMRREELVTEASRWLVALATRVAAGYVAETGPRAILLTGSAAQGVSDTFSDLDLIAYYDRLPSPDQLAAARALIEATAIRAPSSHETERGWRSTGSRASSAR